MMRTPTRDGAVIGLRRIDLFIALLIVCCPLRAHHSAYACLARDRSVTIEGVIEEFRFSEPHVQLVVKTEESIVVRAEWMTPWQLSNGWGITGQILSQGDNVIIRGSPYECEDNRVSLIVEVRRLSDGWTWKSRSDRE